MLTRNNDFIGDAELTRRITARELEIAPPRFQVVLGWLTTVLLVGWLILGLAWLWYVYRHVLGLIRLANGESMPR